MGYHSYPNILHPFVLVYMQLLDVEIQLLFHSHFNLRTFSSIRPITMANEFTAAPTEVILPYFAALFLTAAYLSCCCLISIGALCGSIFFCGSALTMHFLLLQFVTTVYSSDTFSRHLIFRSRGGNTECFINGHVGFFTYFGTLTFILAVRIRAVAI